MSELAEHLYEYQAAGHSHWYEPFNNTQIYSPPSWAQQKSKIYYTNEMNRKNDERKTIAYGLRIAGTDSCSFLWFTAVFKMISLRSMIIFFGLANISRATNNHKSIDLQRKCETGETRTTLHRWCYAVYCAGLSTKHMNFIFIFKLSESTVFSVWFTGFGDSLNN